jgi:hypothetical protein
MNRSVLLGFSIIVLAGLGVLYFLVIRDAPADAGDPAAPVAGTDSPSRTAGTGPSLSTPPTLTSKPTPDRSIDHADREVTDHRTPGGEDRIILAAGSGSADQGPKLPQPLVRTVHYNAMTMVQHCAKKVDKADRGAKPKIGAKLKVAIEDGMLRVKAVTPTTQDLDGPELEAAKACVQTIMMGLEVPAPDVDDIDDYDLSLSYTVR